MQEREQVRTERGKPRLERIESGMDIDTERSVEVEEIPSDLGVPTRGSAYTRLFYSVAENESSRSPRYKAWYTRLVFLILMLEPEPVLSKNIYPACGFCLENLPCSTCADNF
ncbi:hypothetical protein C8F04DRAFT_1242110 [Mycena alexandri]|uniref:Uncharacterized protein n=1 Tax=Mycena alexandri TaxID=1745969 RepID=A0AAD6WMU7_9AGAR|nr:hypothetical protein C8F04DRAFT_1242110 [Mycena alexandri]